METTLSKRMLLRARLLSMPWAVPPEQAALLTQVIGQLEADEKAINTPSTDEWFEAVRMEAAHQQERWGANHDGHKLPEDWFWLLGHLAGKCARAAVLGDVEKALHHTISTAGALLNWYRQMKGEYGEEVPPQ